jgi:hypothetical protein
MVLWMGVREGSVNSGGGLENQRIFLAGSRGSEDVSALTICLINKAASYPVWMDLK